MREALLELLCTSCGHPLHFHRNQDNRLWPCQREMVWKDAVQEQCHCPRATIKGDDILDVLRKYPDIKFVVGVDLASGPDSVVIHRPISIPPGGGRN